MVAVAWVSGLVRLFPLLRGSRMSGLRTRTRMRRCLSHGMRGRRWRSGGMLGRGRSRGLHRRSGGVLSRRRRAFGRRRGGMVSRARLLTHGRGRRGMVRRARLLMRGRRSGGMVARTGFLMQGGKPSRVFAGLRRLMGHAGGGGDMVVRTQRLGRDTDARAV